MKEKFNLIMSLVIFLLFFIYLDDSKYIYTNYYNAKKQSIEKEKPLLIYFKSNQDENILNYKELEKNYIICVLNIDNNKNLLEKFKIQKTPSFVLIDNKTKDICSIEGIESKQKFLAWLFNIRKNNIK